MSKLNINQFGEVSIRVNPGVYVKFSIVDNKGVCPHYTTSTLEDCYLLECFHEDVYENIYALYEVKSGLKFLICAFEKKEEISARAMHVMVLHFAKMLNFLGCKFTYVLSTIIDDLPNVKNELIVKIDGLIAATINIDDIDNITDKENLHLKEMPGALEAISKYISLMDSKTLAAYQ